MRELSSIIPGVVKSERIRRTKLTIAHENKQILDYVIKGATHEQIMKWIGLNEKNYWKRIQAIRKRDLELTIEEQTPESHAFIFRRTHEKIQNLEFLTMQIIQSRTEQTKDKLSAMDFLRRLYIDELSIFLNGPFTFLERDNSNRDSLPFESENRNMHSQGFSPVF